MQMNLCLSGLADCYIKVAYPAAVEEAASLIRQVHPDAVTISEGCRGDISRIARQIGYHLRFSTVIYGGEPFSCIHPGGRGVFGDAVLTEARIVRTTNQEFTAQAGIERRRWLCVTTRVDVDVCTTHLNTRSAVEAPGNDAQCAELAAIWHVARPLTPSSSVVTSTAAPPARPPASGHGTTRLPTRPPAFSRSTGLAAFAHPQRGWCRSRTATTTS